MSDQLIKAAKTRHDSATRKAESALREMSIQRLPITFASVARRAGVSTDFLYRHPVLRSKITSMRSSTIGMPEPRPAAEAANSTSAAVRALSARVKEMTSRHRAEVAAPRARPGRRARRKSAPQAQTDCL